MQSSRRLDRCSRWVFAWACKDSNYLLTDWIRIACDCTSLAGRPRPRRYDYRAYDKVNCQHAYAAARSLYWPGKFCWIKRDGTRPRDYFALGAVAHFEIQYFFN